MDSDRELMLEDARSISQGLWRIAQLAQDAAESLDEKIEEDLRRYGGGPRGARGLERRFFLPLRCRAGGLLGKHVSRP